MSRKTVRAAIQAYIVGADIPNLNSVSLAPLGIDDPEGWLGESQVTYAATSYIWIESDTEQVLTTGAGPGRPGAWRMVTYNVALIFNWYALQLATDDDTWADPLDDMIQAVKTLLRADPAFGNPAVIFDGANLSPDQVTSSISVALDEPLDIDDSDAVLVHGAIIFPVKEQQPPGT